MSDFWQEHAARKAAARAAEEQARTREQMALRPEAWTCSVCGDIRADVLLGICDECFERRAAA